MGKKTKAKTRGNKRVALQKRWFVNATGWGFSLSLGSGLDQASGSKVKRHIEAPDTSQINHFTSQVIVNNDNCYVINPLSGISQGTSTSSRMADRIFITSLSLRTICSNTGATHADWYTSFRFLLIASTQQNTNSGWSSAANVGLANVFRQFTGANVVALPDPQLCRVICDQTITIQPMITGTSCQQILNLDCSVNEWYEFQPGTSVGVAANLYWILVPSQVNIANNVPVGEVWSDFAVVFHN